MAKKEQFMIYLPSKLKRELKVISVKENKTMREIVTELLMNYIKNYYKNQK